MSSTLGHVSDRLITFEHGCIPLPERLLLAHSRGKVLFITGAGTSTRAGLPNFRELVIDTYKKVDTAVHDVLLKIPTGMCNHYEADCASLTAGQTSEVRRFVLQDYDVVLGMLERRMDGSPKSKSTVRQAIADILHHTSKKPTTIHRTLMRLADRGAAVSIITTNFDLLLEKARKRGPTRALSYSLGAIPRPSYREDFSGIFHIHGALTDNPARMADIVVSDQDFGEFYLRRRVVPDFIYDAARLFNLVLIGYSANDPPMRYLLNAVAADGTRFEDLKERFTFVSHESSADPVQLEDWTGRGITPIPYSSENSHRALELTLKKWADIADNKKALDAVFRRLIKTPRSLAKDEDRDLFDHLFRRGNEAERLLLTKLASDSGANIDWLDAMLAISSEKV